MGSERDPCHIDRDDVGMPGDVLGNSGVRRFAKAVKTGKFTREAMVLGVPTRIGEPLP
jgi:hypothetical protein